MILSTNLFFYNKETSTFSAEVSEIDQLRNNGRMPDFLVLNNPKTGKYKRFNFKYCDENKSEGEIYGWNYKTAENDINLLIIND